MLARVRSCFMHEREGENEGVRVRKSLECVRALCLQGCPHYRDKRSLWRTLSSSVRERERGREGERCRIYPELLFLFFKGMMGALAPFRYLVLDKSFIS